MQVDGWQQGFAVPAGGAGVIRLVYTPSVPYRIALWFGGIALLGLFLLAFALVGGDREPIDVVPARPRPLVKLVVVLAGLMVLASWPGLLLGLAVAGVRSALAKPSANGRLDVPWAAATGLCITLAGCVLALRPWGSEHGYAAGRPGVQLLALLTIVLVVVPTVPWRPGRAGVVPASPRSGTATTPPER